ncbi:MAG: TIGR04086 family membrane protein [Ruminococcus sp.]|nr:TIGR04086 family membrane protein [Ruminococcus sp.]
MKAHKRKKKASILEQYRYNIILSVIGGLTIVAVSISICALVLTLLDVSIKVISILSNICIGIGSYSAGYFSAVKGQRSGILSGSICGILIFLTIIFFGIIFNIHGNIISKISKLVICVVCGQIGGIKSANTHNA